MITGNFWMDDDQANTLAGGDVSKFSLLVDWASLARRLTTPAPHPVGYSVRWYVSRLHLGSGQVVDDGAEGNFRPTLLGQVQPYAVYVPSGYRLGHPVGLTFLLHSLEVNYNQYGALDPQLVAQLCQDRDSICVSTEGFGPAGWYYGAAETDFWQVWRAVAQTYSLDPAKTVIAGYSMGGWAAYKLAFEHPDDFAAALVLDGPVTCGIEALPGLRAAAYSQPACSQDGRSRPLVENARWIPYVIDQTAGDELVPTTGVIAQAQAFADAGQRYRLFIHAGGDHLVFAVQDRFGDAVAALGQPRLVRDPASFIYSWYPSLSSRALGIGATGDYWLRGLSARVRAYGVLASITARDMALPARAISTRALGLSLSSEPLPGASYGQSWRLGAPLARRARMRLTLTDVARLTVLARMAALRTGQITVSSDGPLRLAVAQLRPGTRVRVDGRLRAVAPSSGIAAVTLGAGTTRVALLAPSRR